MFPVVATVLHESGGPRNLQEGKGTVLDGNEGRTDVSLLMVNGVFPERPHLV